MTIEDFHRIQDDINTAIWTVSPSRQNVIHADRPWTASVGTSQALTGNGGFDLLPLPWVPDLVGREAINGRGVLIVGFAYAPFMNTGARRAMTPRQYELRRNNVDAFVEYFVERVVEFDSGRYYDKIELLFQNLRKPTELILTDLCKGSFIKRRFNGAIRSDFGGDKVVCGTHPDMSMAERAEAPILFGKYADICENWTWNRLQSVGLRHITTLGKIAEHGLVRLLIRRGCDVRLHGAPDVQPQVNQQDERWAAGRLLPYHPQNWWTQEAGRWWVATHRETNRVWVVLPVLHPARVNDGYQSTANALWDFLEHG